jgi:hypothetical protein
MLGTGLFFVLSIVAFIFFMWLFAAEEKRQKRFFLASARAWLDNTFDRVTTGIGNRLIYLGRHTIKLSWYYSLHKTLRILLTILVKAYDSLEVVFMQNKERARTIKLEKKGLNNPDGHFNQVAEHKASTALSESEKKKLLKKKLERG